MNTFMISKLIYKDWLLFRLYIGIYIVLGGIAAILMTVPSYMVFYIGVVWLITVMIGASAHIVLSGIINEVKESQHSFLVALPIRPIDYTLSKVFGTIGIYLVCWISLVMALTVAILATHLPDGMLTISIILSLEVLLAATILLAVSVLTGSAPISIVTMVILNVFFNLFMFYVAGLEDIGPFINHETIVFNATAFNIIAGEIALIALTLAITLYIKSKKTCFM